ncbi:hypothetical protein OS493_029356 [Desmophyllum pertusum]|uniref:Uncharacterized protein n=1 Tax=Desmophyllum pertusum TaxID=174260 RepID=A0A9W9ZB50_9CNID|nr:hypothetical protein OS493_029356 [Desmophyllum pertusum]
MELKMFDHDFRPSHSQMTEMLKEADLEGHGYEKEVTLRLVEEPGSDKPRYDRSHLYFKIVSCPQVHQIYQEIYTLLPGAFRLDMISKYSKEVKFSHLDSMELCKTGVEVHFKKADTCYENGKVSKCRQKRALSSGACVTTTGHKK